MVWLLSATLDQRHVGWFAADAEWKPTSTERSSSATSADYVHDPDSPPLRYVQTSKHKVLPDLMCGNPSGTYFVSARMRNLIANNEPFPHRFVPITVRTFDKRVLEGEFFIFKHGAYIDDGVIESKSKAVLMGERHEDLAFYSTPAHPKITWKSDAIAGHHFFTDKYLKDRIFVSDNFLRLMKREKHVTSLKIIESFEE